MTDEAEATLRALAGGVPCSTGTGMHLGNRVVFTLQMLIRSNGAREPLCEDCVRALSGSMPLAGRPIVPIPFELLGRPFDYGGPPRWGWAPDPM